MGGGLFVVSPGEVDFTNDLCSNRRWGRISRCLTKNFKRYENAGWQRSRNNLPLSWIINYANGMDVRSDRELILFLDLDRWSLCFEASQLTRSFPTGELRRERQKEISHPAATINFILHSTLLSIQEDRFDLFVEPSCKSTAFFFFSSISWLTRTIAMSTGGGLWRCFFFFSPSLSLSVCLSALLQLLLSLSLSFYLGSAYSW